MSLVPDTGVNAGMIPAGDAPVPIVSGRRPLHRIAEIRRRQGISVRTAARRLQTSMEQVRRQEDPCADLSISDLHRWQAALEVPLAELLVEGDGPLAEPVLFRARLLRVMKTVRAIRQSQCQTSVERLATMLEQQLVEVMPELKEVAAWHSVGQRRSPHELGRAADRVLPDSFFTDWSE